MPKSRPLHPREFREEAVRLARTSGCPVAEIARELEVTWGGRSSQACAVTGQLTAEREEIAAGSADPAGGTGSPEGTREVRDFTGTAGEGAAAVFAQRTVQAVEAFGQVGARGGANHGVARRGIEGLPSSYYV